MEGIMRKFAWMFIAILMILVGVLTYDLARDYQVLNTSQGRMILAQTMLPLKGSSRCVNYSSEDHPGPLDIIVEEGNWSWVDNTNAFRTGRGFSFYHDAVQNSLVFKNSNITERLDGDQLIVEREYGDRVGVYSKLRNLPTNLVVILNGERRILNLSYCEPPLPPEIAMYALNSALINP